MPSAIHEEEGCSGYCPCLRCAPANLISHQPILALTEEAFSLLFSIGERQSYDESENTS